MSFLSKLCNDNESRVQDSADVTVGSLSDADLREAVHSVLGDNYRLVNIVRHDGDFDLHLESERDGTVYQYYFFEAGHESVDSFKRELSATKLLPVSSYEKKVGDSKVRRRAQDSDDLSGWVKSDGGRLWKAIYRKEYDDMLSMRIFVREESVGQDEFSVDPYLLRDLRLEDLADTLHITTFDSFSEAADVADRIAASYSTFYKSLSDIIGE